MSRAFVFPGQGAQTIGMGKALAAAYPAAKAVFDEVDEALGERLQRGGQRLRPVRVAQNEPGDAAGAIDRTPAGRCGIKADEEVARKERPARLPQHARPRDGGENLWAKTLNFLPL